MMLDYSYYLQVLGSILAILGAIYNCSPNRCDKATGFGTSAYVPDGCTLVD
jgi:hypothetical protein